MSTVKKFKTTKMPINEYLISEDSVHEFVNRELHDFTPKTFTWEVCSITKFDLDTLLVGFHITYDDGL